MVDIPCDANIAYQAFFPCTGYGDTYSYDNSVASCELGTEIQAYHCAPTDLGQCQDAMNSTDIENTCKSTGICNWEPVGFEPLSIVTDCGTLLDQDLCENSYLNEPAETTNKTQYPSNFYPVCAWNNYKCVRGDNDWSPLFSLMCYT